MPSPAEPNDKLRPLPRWLRWIRWFTWKRVRRILIVGSVVVTAGYWIENIRGRRAFQKVLDRYAEAGISLDPQHYLAAELPPEDNFGATPLLDGIAAEEWKDQDGVATEIKKWRRFPFQRYQTAERNSNTGLSYYRNTQGKRPKAAGKHQTTLRPDDAPMPAVRAIDWYRCWAELGDHRNAAPPESPVQAVYATLDTERAVFDELVAASLKGHALFTPIQPLRTVYRLQDRRGWLGSLCNLLRLRASAAATLGNNAEAVALARVLWRIREAFMAEPGDYWYRFTALNQWIACAEDVVRSGTATDANLSELLDRPVHHWKAEEELLRSLSADAAASAHSWQLITQEASWNVTGDLERAFRYRWIDETTPALLVPRGWLEQNGALYLGRFLDHRITPLREGGLGAVPAADAAWDADWFDNSPLGWWHPYRYFIPYWYAVPVISLQLPTHAICRIRLTILALGMERYRLAHGRYPADPAALVPQFLPALPPDMDRAPLRCVTRADGSGAVLYSIGWNLTDDWHGVIPDGKGEPHYSEADWTLSLPLPPLNPP